jgi:hypothetical protein
MVNDPEHELECENVDDQKTFHLLSEKETNDVVDTNEMVIDDQKNKNDKTKSSDFYMFMGNKMRIIKPVLSDNQNADIADNAARALYFLVVDDDKFIKSIKNPFTI